MGELILLRNKKTGEEITAQELADGRVLYEYEDTRVTIVGGVETFEQMRVRLQIGNPTEWEIASP